MLLVEQLGAVVLALGFGGLVAVVEGSTWSQVWSAFATHDDPAVYPAVRLTVVAAVVAVSAPHLARPQRRVGTWLVVLGAVASLALALDTVLGIAAGLVLGVTVGALVHLVAGSPGGHVPLEQLRTQLEDLGVELTDLRYIDEPGHMSVVARGSDPDGRVALVRVYGRDAWEASLLASLWQRLWYRQTTASSVGRQERAEHEAFVTMVAERAGVPVQAVLAAGTAWGKDAMLVRRDEGVPLPDAAPEAYGEAPARRSWAALAGLHGAGVVHGDLRSRSLSVAADGVIRLTDLASASLSVVDTARAADRAHLLVISALRLGIDDAVRIARDAVGDDALVTAMPYLQTAAFDDDTRREIKAASWKLGALRDAIVAEPVPRRRRWRNCVASRGRRSSWCWSLLSSPTC